MEKPSLAEPEREDKDGVYQNMKLFFYQTYLKQNVLGVGWSWEPGVREGVTRPKR